jgi:hypothetical protein
MDGEVSIGKCGAAICIAAHCVRRNTLCGGAQLAASFDAAPIENGRAIRLAKKRNGGIPRAATAGEGRPRSSH